MQCFFPCLEMKRMVTLAADLLCSPNYAIYTLHSTIYTAQSHLGVSLDINTWNLLVIDMMLLVAPYIHYGICAYIGFVFNLHATLIVLLEKIAVFWMRNKATFCFLNESASPLWRPQCQGTKDMLVIWDSLKKGSGHKRIRGPNYPRLTRYSNTMSKLSFINIVCVCVSFFFFFFFFFCHLSEGSWYSCSGRIPTTQDSCLRAAESRDESSSTYRSYSCRYWPITDKWYSLLTPFSHSRTKGVVLRNHLIISTHLIVLNEISKW